MIILKYILHTWAECRLGLSTVGERVGKLVTEVAASKTQLNLM